MFRFFFRTRTETSLTIFLVFFFNDTATTEIYTLSLHDALPIWARAGLLPRGVAASALQPVEPRRVRPGPMIVGFPLITPLEHLARHILNWLHFSELRMCRARCSRDRKSTRLNSSH